MATYERFEDLPVWQEAIRLAEEVEDFLDAVGKQVSWSKRDQIERASLSVSNNIAEGFERGSTAELVHFIYIARGSAGEVRSMLCFFERRPALRDFKSQILNLKSRAESCSRQLRAWADHLQNSEIKGQRHLNDTSRDQYAKKKTRTADGEKWQGMVREQILKMAPDHPMRMDWERKHGPVEGGGI
jgi:four helix bundle protein